SSLLISTTRMRGSSSAARAAWYCAAVAQTVTGSKRAMALATAANAAWAGAACSRQLSGRCGQTIQVWLCGAHSAGMKKPSARGVVLRVVMTISVDRVETAADLLHHRFPNGGKRSAVFHPTHGGGSGGWLRAVQGLDRAVQVGSAVAEDAPGAADVFELVKIELVHQHAFAGAVHFLDLLAELVGDERGAVEGDVVTVLLLGTDAVAGNQRHQVGAGVALLDTLPVVARGDVRVMRLAADGGGIEQQFGAHQRHAAGSFREPLVPAD